MTSSQTHTKNNNVPMYTGTDSSKYMRMGGKVYKVVEKHEEEYSNLEYEDNDEDKTVYDFEEKIIAQLNLKLLKKVEEKKWLFDKIFNGWLAVLELKKKFLFELWRMKQGKKKKDSGEHYEYFIPYYTSTYKPHLQSKTYTYESGYGHEAGHQSPDHYKDDHHIANDEHEYYVADKHEKDDICGSVDHQTENPYDHDSGYQSPNHYGDNHQIPSDENDIAVKHEEGYDQYRIVDKLKLKAYENPFQVQENFNEEIGDAVQILEENVSSGLSNNGEHLIPFFTPTNKPNLEDPLRVTENINNKEENSNALSSNDEYSESLLVQKSINDKSPKDLNSKAMESNDGSSPDTRETLESKLKASSDSNSLKPSSSDSSGILSSLQNFLKGTTN